MSTLTALTYRSIFALDIMMKKSERNLVNWVFESAVMLTLLAFGGNYLDERYETSPLLTSLGVFLGIVVIAWNFYKIYLEVTKE